MLAVFGLNLSVAIIPRGRLSSRAGTRPVTVPLALARASFFDVGEEAGAGSGHEAAFDFAGQKGFVDLGVEDFDGGEFF